ncbi:hypothetical protein [Bacillus salipaludis]|uniref:Uncharacterized protein n=1 Tax=Bacillus salipaludis TaxID=2547811 RepID=A0AA90ZA77_9BACI|nr:hypothetical protein [Bacillus salipaludis]MDQ6600850.1 hypothetical protein [Bacillus salipaludis]
MSTINVKISAKDSTTSRNNAIEFIVDTKRKEEKIRFFLVEMRKEVVSLPKKEQKVWKKKLLIAYQTCVSMLVLVKPAAAATPALSTNLIPTDLLQVILQLEFLAVILGVGLAQLCFVGAGIYRILRKEKISKEWSVDIIKGLVQILIAPIVIMTITYIIYFLFGNSEWFINPLEIYSHQKSPFPSPQ